MLCIHLNILRALKCITCQFLCSNITGDFKDAEVHVFNNNLTRFEESVFGPMLQEMASGEGFVDAGRDSGSI